ncbi:MAG: NAD-dependent epimerase/dehydratase family protein [Solirubrobacteraceae bacterium]|nr:NAD-dependent epimerase/dehydratase family protein [Patulibacter sp.]
MKIVVTGATGNVGTALLRALVDDDQITEIVGIARRIPPTWAPRKVHWVSADVSRDPLEPHFAGADVVVHLAWLIQPARSTVITERVNVEGSRRVFQAAGQAGVGALVHASSVAAYSRADPMEPVDEGWPTGGLASSYYSRQKVAAERLLDDTAARFPELRIARARPGLIFQRSAAAEIRRYFGGPLVPGWAARSALVPFVPDMPGLVGQVVHSDDVAELYRLLCVTPTAEGAYNVATSPPVDAAVLAHLLHARPRRLPRSVVRGLVKTTYLARLHPVSPGWLDLGLAAPTMLTDRARNELGWHPVHEAGAVLTEFMDGLRSGAGGRTPPLDPHAGGPLRVREFLTGVGGPNPIDR